MKNIILKYTLFIATLAFIVACSVKKDKFINRKFHSVTAEYNILYNGNLALEDGKASLVNTYKDDFWEVLPVERMPKKEDAFLPGQTKNPNFERAEEKAVKAIQKHAMNIDGLERNPEMDEAYLLLGKARYYDNRFIPALEAVNYILFKYPTSNNIYQAKVWREKIHIRMDNNEVAITNLLKLVKDKKIKGQDEVDANAMLTQAFLNSKQEDSAIVYMKKAAEGATINEEKARYQFILAQLYENAQKTDSAQLFYNQVIAMNRKAPRRYVIQAEAKKVLYFDYEKKDTLAFNEYYQKLIDNRENRPFLDVLYHYKGLYYEKLQNTTLAEKYYNKSVRSYSDDSYLVASNYRNIGEIYFDKTNYKQAGKYYDSTLLRMNDRTREYKKIKKKRDNLQEVIYLEDIATRNDSIITVVRMSPKEQGIYYGDYIKNLRKKDSLAGLKELERLELELIVNANNAANPGMNQTVDGGMKNFANPEMAMEAKKATFQSQEQATMPPSNFPQSGGSQNSNFYFYNPVTVAYGKKEFQNKWGKRAYKENWRLGSDGNSAIAGENTEDGSEDLALKSSYNPLDEKYTIPFYTNQLPTKTEAIDSIGVERNNAYFQLGVLYKEKFKIYKLAAKRLETLLKNDPEARLIIPAKYNLVKIYEEIDPAKALQLKNEFILEFPDTRYAQILQNPNTVIEDDQNPEKVFEKVYKQFQNNEIRLAKTATDTLLSSYFGEDILPKFEVLDAKISGRLEGVKVYKDKLNYVAVTYPNLKEGKEAQRILDTDIPQLEAYNFVNKETATWKILFPKEYLKEAAAENELVKILQNYIADAYRTDLKVTVDLYDFKSNFVVVHGFKSKESATMFMSVLKDYKAYKIKDAHLFVATDNYTVIQMQKRLAEYIENNPKL